MSHWLRWYNRWLSLIFVTATLMPNSEWFIMVLPIIALSANRHQSFATTWINHWVAHVLLPLTFQIFMCAARPSYQTEFLMLYCDWSSQFENNVAPADWLPPSNIWFSFAKIDQNFDSFLWFPSVPPADENLFGWKSSVVRYDSINQCFLICWSSDSCQTNYETHQFLWLSQDIFLLFITNRVEPILPFFLHPYAWPILPLFHACHYQSTITTRSTIWAVYAVTNSSLNQRYQYPDAPPTFQLSSCFFNFSIVHYDHHCPSSWRYNLELFSASSNMFQKTNSLIYLHRRLPFSLPNRTNQLWVFVY